MRSVGWAKEKIGQSKVVRRNDRRVTREEGNGRFFMLVAISRSFVLEISLQSLNIFLIVLITEDKVGTAFCTDKCFC